MDTKYTEIGILLLVGLLSQIMQYSVMNYLETRAPAHGMHNPVNVELSSTSSLPSKLPNNLGKSQYLDNERLSVCDVHGITLQVLSCDVAYSKLALLRGHFCP